MTELAELLTRAEELDDRLGAYLGDSILGPVIKHPLVFSIPHSHQLNALANERLRQKLLALEVATRQHDWSQYLFLHERPYRIHAFAQVADRLDDVAYWRELGYLWIDSENIADNHDLWRDLLQDENRCAQRSQIMTADERAVWAALPDRVRVYRGFNEPGRALGMSWSLKRAVAQRFALRFGYSGATRIATGFVSKAEVVAYFARRGEDEVVVVSADAVSDVTISRVLTAS